MLKHDTSEIISLPLIKLFYNWITIIQNTNSTFIMSSFVLENKDYNTYYVRILELKILQSLLQTSKRILNIESTLSCDISPKFSFPPQKFGLRNFSSLNKYIRQFFLQCTQFGEKLKHCCADSYCTKRLQRNTKENF